jgi:hypothetical protein
MFVFNTIEIKKSPEKIVIKTPRSLRILAGITVLACYGFLLLALSSMAASRYIVAGGLYFFIFIGLWVTLFRKQIEIDSKTSRVFIEFYFLGKLFKQHVVAFADVLDIYSEERSHGQTIQPKLRLFLQTAKKVHHIGILNQVERANSFVSLLKEKITPATSENLQ